MAISKKRIYEILEKTEKKDVIGKIVDWFIIILIFLNVGAVIVNSFTYASIKYRLILLALERFSIVVFTVEYLLRIWTSAYKYPDSRHPVIRYIFSLMAIIDLAAIIPFYLPFVVNLDLRYLRVLRLFRLLRVLKLNRYNNSLAMIGRVLKNEKEKMFMTLFIITVLLLLASSTMYYFENAVQPEYFPNIPATLWWAVATLTTVGYGDVYPITIQGKILSGIIAILGIGLVALPSGIISSGFINEVSKNGKKTICPHCGKEIDAASD
ncbi:MAG: ion transporter [Spirochaetaceae bacterium]|jgi:voltage-gated potassium channel|nr:ion transporter [Spirochaetaceae bacterium]